MTPYYQHDGITIFHGDCREILPQLERASIDVVAADPPYGDTSLDWDEQDIAWLALARPLLNEHGSVWCFGSLRSFMLQAAAILRDWRLAQDLVWEKHNGSGFQADRFRRVHEHIVHLYPKDAPWSAVHKFVVTTPDAVARHVRRKRRPAHMGNIGAGHFVAEDGGPRMMRSVLYVRSCHGEAEHPTQKPVAALEPILRYSCPPDGLALDPTMGAGSLLVAAKATGRRAIGIEIQERYCEIAARRLTESLRFAEAR